MKGRSGSNFYEMWCYHSRASSSLYPGAEFVLFPCMYPYEMLAGFEWREVGSPSCTPGALEKQEEVWESLIPVLKTASVGSDLVQC